MKAILKFTFNFYYNNMNLNTRRFDYLPISTTTFFPLSKKVINL